MYNSAWLGFIDRLTPTRPLRVRARMPLTRCRHGLSSGAVAIVLIAALPVLERSPWGRVMKAIREDEAAATAAGKNVFAFKMQALVLGAVLGAHRRLLLAWQIGVFSPDDYQPTLTFYAYLILILGGSNRIWAIPLGVGPVQPALFRHALPNFFPLSLINSGARAFLRLFLVGLLLVLFMAFRPEGILGNRRELLLEK